MGATARLLAAAGLLFVALAATALGAQAFSTPGASGNLTLDSMGAPPSALWKVSATPPVYQVNETLIISAGDVLVIPAGVQLNFTNTTELIVLGGLVVQGTASAPVVMGVVPDTMSMAVAWGGIRAQGAFPVVIDNAVLRDSIDFLISNSSGPRLTNVTYQGRLMFDNVSGATAAGILMTIAPTDVGRIGLWVENSDLVTVAGADLQGGTGWGGSAVLIEDSTDIVVSDLTVRDDNANLVGVQVIASTRVTISNYTFTQGPMGGDPNQALDFRDADAVVVDRLVMTQVGLSGLGAIYGVRSNATVSNSTFDPTTFEGVWQYPGTLTGVNATRLPVRPQAGATVRDFELIRVAAQWEAGGGVASGVARVENDSWLAQGPIQAGSSGSMWALRSSNLSGALTLTESYRVSVTCNCTGGEAFVNLTDAWGLTVVVFVGDNAPPVVSATATAGRTGEPVFLNASASTDNAGVAAYMWTAVGGSGVSGLPCAQARCEAVFDAPGNFTVQVNVTDTAGQQAFARLTVAVLDVTPPRLTWVSTGPPRPGQGEPFQAVVAALDNDPAFLPQVQWYVDGARIPGDTLTVTLSLDTLGGHNVSVIVRDDGGNQASAYFIVEVRDVEPPRVGLWVTPTGLVAPASLQLNGSVATDNVRVTAWKWRVVGPGTDYNQTGPSPNATFPAAGAYNVTLTVEDGEGNKASRTFEVAVAAPPVVGGDGGWQLVLLVVAGGAAAVALAAVILRRPREPPKPVFDESGKKKGEPDEGEQKSEEEKHADAADDDAADDDAADEDKDDDEDD